METGLKWKIWGIVGSVVLGLYALVPTFFGFPEQRQELQAAQQPLPWYLNIFPEKGLNLGLDLRGGIYIEMDILADEGVRTKLDLLAQEVIRDLKKRGAEPISFKQENLQTLEFVFSSNDLLENALPSLRKNYSDLLTQEALVKGAAAVRYTVDAAYLAQVRQDIISQAVQAVRNRIDRYGLAEPTVQRQGSERLVVELPGVKDPERAIKIIQQAGKLEFKLVSKGLSPTQVGNLIAEARTAGNLTVGYSAEEVQKLNEALAGKLPEGTEVAFELARDPATGNVTQARPYLLERTVYVTGDMLKNAQVQIDPQTSRPYVSLTFNSVGAKNFGDLTKAHVQEELAILLDGNVSSAPVIREPILNGECRIDLGASASRQDTLKEAKDLTLVLQEGALPARLKEASKTVIGPTLGADSIQKSLNSLLVGSAIVVLFMIFYYKLSGILANAALLLNTLFTFALLAMFQATLTLPGMAGIVLSIGMAVDANILIFERIREELNAGQQPRAAIDAGYKNAIRAIMDSNLTTIIAGVILYQYGTGPIRGFAVTLMIGLVCNLFTAVMMTRTVYDYCLTKWRPERISI